MKPGDIFLGQFPFGDTPGMKLRPLLLLSPVTGPFAEILVAYISSVIPAELLATDLLLDPAHPKTRSSGRSKPGTTSPADTVAGGMKRSTAPAMV